MSQALIVSDGELNHVLPPEHLSDDEIIPVSAGLLRRLTQDRANLIRSNFDLQGELILNELEAAKERTTSDPERDSSKTPSKFDIAKEFCNGAVAAISVTTIKGGPGLHWTAGWKAGRDFSRDSVNRYLASIGVEPMGVINAMPAAISTAETPSFETLTEWLHRVPITWLPGLLAQCVASCVHGPVFQAGQLVKFVEKAERDAADTASILRKQ